MTTAPLTDDQIEILDYTAHRAAYGRYCGHSDAMRGLVALGFMQSLGKVSWCQDEFFGLTAVGRGALRGLPARGAERS